MMGSSSQCYILSFTAEVLVLEKKSFEEFLSYIQPSWSCDIDPLNKLLIPRPMKVSHEIWLQWVQWFRMKMLKDGQMTDALLYHNYKLTYELKGSGELKKTTKFTSAKLEKKVIYVTSY